MAETLKICTELSLPEEMREKAAADAIAENPENLPSLMPSSSVGVHADRSLMALISGKKWARGRVLDVSFIGGNAAVIEKVIRYARKWEEFAEIRFNFVDRNGTIRIAFDPPGSWSNLGTDALQIPANKPTMNFGWLKPNTEDDEYSRVVIHEFGHALGCIHEHQHPTAGIPWNKEAVYKYYKDSQNWNKAKTDNNIFRKYSAAITNFSEYDKFSIMHYAVPKALTIGGYEVGWNRILSRTDKRFIAEIY